MGEENMEETNNFEENNSTVSVYIKINEYNKIIAVNSDIFINDTENWLKIDEGTGDKYAHAQGNYFDKPLIDDRGLHNYIYENEAVREATAAEKEEELQKMPKPAPCAEADLLNMAIDHEYRLTVLELGVN